MQYSGQAGCKAQTGTDTVGFLLNFSGLWVSDLARDQITFLHQRGGGVS